MLSKQHREAVPAHIRLILDGNRRFACGVGLDVHGARAILLQVANLQVGRGVADHSDFANRSFERLCTSLTYIYCIIFGKPEEKQAISKTVTAVHRRVKGPGYTALDPELQACR